jgi:hypothetical protein
MNCSFARNSADYGGGLSAWASQVTSNNCTIAENEGGYGGGSHLFEMSQFTARNCIIWGNTGFGWSDADDQLHAQDSFIMVSFSCIQDEDPDDEFIPWGGAGNFNIDDNPLFVSGPTYDYYLCEPEAGHELKSPCIDSGNATAATLGIANLSTRCDLMPDEGMVDMGYHMPYSLRVHSITRSAEGVVVKWNARPGARYVLEWSSDLVVWRKLYVGPTDTWLDTTIPSSAKFFRVSEHP